MFAAPINDHVRWKPTRVLPALVRSASRCSCPIHPPVIGQLSAATAACADPTISAPDASVGACHSQGNALTPKLAESGPGRRTTSPIRDKTGPTYSPRWVDGPGTTSSSSASGTGTGATAAPSVHSPQRRSLLPSPPPQCSRCLQAPVSTSCSSLPPAAAVWPCPRLPYPQLF